MKLDGRRLLVFFWIAALSYCLLSCTPWCRSWKAAAFLRFAAAFVLVSFFPGSFLSYALRGPDRIKTSSFVFRSFGLSVAVLIPSTTLMKLGGVGMSPTTILGLQIAFSLIALPFLFKRRAFELEDDIRQKLPALLTGAFVLVVLGILLWPRITMRKEDFWLVEILRKISFPEKSNRGSVVESHSRDLRAEGDYTYTCRDRQAYIRYDSPRGESLPFHLLFLVNASSPALFSIKKDGQEIGSWELPYKYIKDGEVHSFMNQAIAEASTRLDPGPNVLQMEFKPVGLRRSDAFSFRIHDFSGLGKRDFIKRLNKVGLVANIGHHYDVLEVETHTISLLTKPYIWGNRFSTGGREGYYVSPHFISCYAQSLVLAVVGGKHLLVINILDFAVMLMIYWSMLNIIQIGGMRLATGGIIILNCFITHFIMGSFTSLYNFFPDSYQWLFFLLAILFYLEEDYGYFALFSILAILSRPPLLILMALLFAYHILNQHKYAGILKACLWIACGMLVYAGLVFWLGWSNNLLAAWKTELWYEYCFKSMHEAGPDFTDLVNLKNLLRWSMIMSCLLLPVVCITPKDQVGKVGTTLSLGSFAFLMMQYKSRVYRMHYVYQVAIFAVLAICRIYVYPEGKDGTNRLIRNHWIRLVIVLIAILSIPLHGMFFFEYGDFNSWLLWLPYTG